MIFFVLGLLLIIINVGIFYFYNTKEKNINALENTIKDLNLLKKDLSKRIENLNQKISYNQEQITHLIIQNNQKTLN